MDGGRAWVEASGPCSCGMCRAGAPGYGAVDGLSLTVRAGGAVGLVGESGSGKSVAVPLRRALPARPAAMPRVGPRPAPGAARPRGRLPLRPEPAMTRQASILLAHCADVRRLYFRGDAVERLARLGSVKLNESGAEWTTQQLVEAARGCDIVVAYRETPGDAAVFDGLPGLKAYVRCAVDIRDIDQAAASRNGVLVTHVSGVFVSGVAEWIIAMMIDLNRRFSASISDYRAGLTPRPAIGAELRGSTLGVIGYGRIGRYLCDLALAFGMKVLAADPCARVEHAAVTQCSLPELLAAADQVVCLAVANRETENLMDAAAFALMKPSAYFVNPSRGNLVDEAALLAALREGRIAGCALDVGRAPDQMPSPALTAHPLVIATPHVAGQTPALDGQSAEAIAQVGEILAGRVPAGALNAAHATRLAAFAGAGAA